MSNEREPEMRLRLDELQVLLHKWCKKNFPKTTATQQFIGIVEEVGELAHCVLKGQQGIRKGIVDREIEEMDAVGDIIIYLMNFCSYRKYDFESLLSSTAGEVMQRDWQRYPHDGVNK